MLAFVCALVLVGLCVLGLCFNVIVRGKDFPKYDVGSNRQMKERGILCFKDVDAGLHGGKCGGNGSDDCRECSHYGTKH
ncbi:MAG: hypothetical protein MJY44_01940 [Bacteroidales bacterium]|nr:hypothetical protein [Bacteroidales bacterium]